MSHEAAGPETGPVYHYPDAAAIAALPPNEQFNVAATPPVWYINEIHRLVAEPGEPDLLNYGDDSYSPATAYALLREPGICLITKLYAVNHLSLLLANAACLSPDFQNRLIQVDMFQDESLGCSISYNLGGHGKLGLTGDPIAAKTQAARAATVRSHRDIAAALAERDGIDPALIYWSQEYDDEGYDIQCPFDRLPLAGIAFLQYVRQFCSRDGGYLPELLRPLVPVAGELTDALLELARQRDTTEAYMQFVLGPDLIGMREELAAIDPEGAAKLDEQLPRFLEAAEVLAAGYPADWQSAIRDAYLEKTLASVYGYVAHISEGRRLRKHITVGGGLKLPVEYNGDEPFVLMDDLNAVILEDAALENDPATLVTRCVQDAASAGFQVYRLTRTCSGVLRQSLRYCRPWGATDYNDRLEYGRRGEGVEGSLGKILKRHPGYLPIGKHAATLPDTISIRVDREGVDPRIPRSAAAELRDPTSEIGMLSLDIGSVLGPESNLGVRVGRFLALCAELRAERVSAERSTLNHAANYFRPSRAAEFALIVERYMADYERRAAHGSQDELNVILRTLQNAAQAVV